MKSKEEPGGMGEPGIAPGRAGGGECDFCGLREEGEEVAVPAGLTTGAKARALGSSTRP